MSYQQKKFKVSKLGSAPDILIDSWQVSLNQSLEESLDPKANLVKFLGILAEAAFQFAISSPCLKWLSILIAFETGIMVWSKTASISTISSLNESFLIESLIDLIESL